MNSSSLCQFSKVKGGAPPHPSLYDPSYLLFLEFSNLPVTSECLTKPKDIEPVRKRFNQLTLTPQGDEKISFHHWVTGIAEKLGKDFFSLQILTKEPHSREKK